MAQPPKETVSDTDNNGRSVTSESLDKFFYDKHTVDLDNCDREPIHYIGSVQKDTGLLIVAKNNHQLVGFSNNLSPWLQTKLSNSTQTYDFSYLAPELAQEAKDLLTTVSGYHALMESNFSLGEHHYQCVFHQHGANYYIELFPEADFSVTEFRAKANSLRKACGKIMAADTFAAALTVAAEEAKAQTGFARVNIYEFQHDWSGKVVAESLEPHMPGFLGLYFPASDIPKQARYLQTLVPYRSIGYTDEEQGPKIVATQASPHKDPFDLTWSLVRSVSPIHLQYLRNMRVQATFTVSLVKDGKLWGLIACHHDQPGILPFDQWEAMNTLATVLMSKLDQQQARDNAGMMKRLREIEEDVAEIIREKGSIEESLSTFMPQLRIFLRADGFAFKYGNHLYTEGDVPPDDFILKLIRWADQRTDELGSFSTNSLPSDWPEARSYADKVCGVLIEPVQLHRICHLAWFRKPITNSVAWAGKHEAKSSYRDADGTEKLLPRRSFELWHESNANRSERWTAAELTSARELLKNMLDIVASQIQLAKVNRDMEIFSFSAAHDLKTPLRHMNFALEMMQRLGEGTSQEQLNDLVGQAANSYNRLKGVIDGMMKLLELENTSPEPDVLSVTEVIAEAEALLASDISESGTTITLIHAKSDEVIPKVRGSRELLTNVFTNLFGNSIKYRDPARPVVICIKPIKREAVVDILISDNGQGIPADKVDDVFKPFQRLHRFDQVPGSGLGLSICQRSVAAMGGEIRIDRNYAGPGVQFVITLQLAHAQ